MGLKLVLPYFVYFAIIVPDLKAKNDLILTDRSSDSIVNRNKHVIGLNAYGNLNTVSILYGIEKKRNYFGLSFSHLYMSTRFGLHYNYRISQKYRMLFGFGFHKSYQIYEFRKSEEFYLEELETEQREITSPDFAFLPNYGEVRELTFISVSIRKEFKLYRELYTLIEAEFVGCYNKFYDKFGFAPLIGIQLHYKL